jgi:hypothetical protein
MNDGEIRAVGYCSPWQQCPDCTGHGCEKCEERGIVKAHDYTEHVHATREEAEECFLRYLLDGASEHQFMDWSGCEVCDEPTKMGLSTRGPLGSPHVLCDEHRTPEILAGLTPWPSQIIASY